MPRVRLADRLSVDRDGRLWRWRDTLALIGLLAWGAGWTVFALVQLAAGPLVERRTLFDLFCLSVGLAGLYVAVGVTAIRLWELIGQSRNARS